MPNRVQETRSIRQNRAYQDLPGGPGGSFKWLAEGRSASSSVAAGAAVAELQGSGPGGPVLARGRFYWASLRVARWVANRCVRVLLCVAPRCSPSVSLLVTLHSCWSVEVPALTGMQEVSGSSPLSSTRNCRSGHDLRPVRVHPKIVRPSPDRRSEHRQLALNRTDRFLMTAQDGPRIMCVEHAGDRDGMAGISMARLRWCRRLRLTVHVRA
jgi:hypothetical protein